ncbi:hypothetical protein [Mesorhizobium sp.]|uniref:hypothetical protein n=1 Tax=Mesorhizobium sp. TaxID=1871066 RepID=UPI000FE7F673|nr:hypothetical protein [Mesorhizobium sp.]RWP62573.1 MAG: hypothetical protein EOR07_19885 [Mesorhizobium sp.]
MGREPIEGAMFRQNYLRQDVPLEDSARARARLAALFDASPLPDREFRHFIQQELGVGYEVHRGYISTFWQSAEIADVLSAVTLWFNMLRGFPQTTFLTNARRIFAEEHLRYRIDDRGGVHFLVDEEFERATDAALVGLGAPQFAAAKHALEEALGRLNPPNQSGKALIRGVFEAAESAFLVVIGEEAANRLNDQSVDRFLKPMLLARHAAHPDAEDKVDRALAVFKGWVRAAHPFRHGAPLDQIHEAPIDMAVMLASMGMDFIRYMVAR